MPCARQLLAAASASQQPGDTGCRRKGAVGWGCTWGAVEGVRRGQQGRAGGSLGLLGSHPIRGSDWFPAKACSGKNVRVLLPWSHRVGVLFLLSWTDFRIRAVWALGDELGNSPPVSVLWCRLCPGVSVLRVCMRLRIWPSGSRAFRRRVIFQRSYSFGCFLVSFKAIFDDLNLMEGFVFISIDYKLYVPALKQSLYKVGYAYVFFLIPNLSICVLFQSQITQADLPFVALWPFCTLPPPPTRQPNTHRPSQGVSVVLSPSSWTPSAILYFSLVFSFALFHWLLNFF